MLRLTAALSAAAAVLAVSTAAAADAAANQLAVGANVEGVDDWSATLPFVDVTKQSRAWGSAAAPWDGNCTLDAAGIWPAQSDFGNIFASVEGTPGGPYTPSIAGNWTLVFTGNATVSPTNVMAHGTAVLGQAYDPATDTTTAVLSIPVAVNDGSCNCIMLSFTGASTKAYGPGARDIKLLQPGYTLAQANDFSTPLLTLLSRFTVLRFMDWAATNGNLKGDWSQRAQPAGHSWAGGVGGVPWETCFDLCNTLQKDCWINVPVNASDDYVTSLATLAKARLNASLSLYVEYSNEVWNFGFAQYRFNFEAANASVYAGDPHGFNNSQLEGVNNPGAWALYRYVWASAHIASLFEGVYGPGSVGRDKAVRPVFAWQENGGSVQEQGFAYLRLVLGLLPAQVFHAMALAPYITMGDVASSPTLTVDQVLAGWESWAANVSIRGPYGSGGPNFIAPFAATCAFWGLECRAYEAGPDTVEGLDAGSPLWAKGNASLDARIEPMLVSYVQDWASLGAHMGPLNWYNAGAGTVDSQYGIYTLLYDMTKQDTAKLDAIDTAIAAGPVPPSALIPTVPATLNASFFAGHPVPASPNGFFGWPSILNYPVQSPAALSVNIVVTAASEYPGNFVLQIGLGGQVPDVRNVTCVPSGSWTTYTPCDATAPFALPAGVSTIRVVRPQHPPWVGQVIVTAA